MLWSPDGHFIQYLSPVTIQNQASSQHKLQLLKAFVTALSQNINGLCHGTAKFQQIHF
jgi:hypothetical protein